MMRLVLRIVLVVVGLILVVTGWALAFNEPVIPPDFPGVSRYAEGLDFSDLPVAQNYVARDGAKLVFRHYAAEGHDTVVLIHGATLRSASMHFIGKALQARGATAYSIGVRGHEGDGPVGDVAYFDQPIDDLADFLKTLPARREGERRTLVGFSAGGNLSLAVSALEVGRGFDRLVLVAPSFGRYAPLNRPNGSGFYNVAVPRALVLDGMNAMGVTYWNGLAVAAYGVPAGNPRVYTYRMAMAFGGGRTTSLDDLRKAHGQVRLVAGSDDEVFYADQYAPAVQTVRADAEVTILPGFKHMDMIVKPQAVAVVVDKVLGE